MAGNGSVIVACEERPVPTATVTTEIQSSTATRGRSETDYTARSDRGHRISSINRHGLIGKALSCGTITKSANRWRKTDASLKR